MKSSTAIFCIPSFVRRTFFAAGTLFILSLVFSTPAMAAVTGHLDGADPTTIVGWAWDNSDAQKTVSVVIEAIPSGSDKAVHTWTLEADDYRADVENFIGSGNHGFFCTVDWSAFSNQELTLKAYAVSGDERIPLTGTVTYKPASGQISYPTGEGASAEDSGTQQDTSKGPGVQAPSYATSRDSATQTSKDSSATSTSVPKDKMYLGPGYASVSGGSSSQPQQGDSLGMFTTTGYCNCDLCSGDSKLTYSGTVPQANHTLAADLDVFPLGTKLMIDGIVYTVEDMGSGVNGHVLDIYYANHSEAVAHGTRQQEVFRVIE